MSQFCYDSVAAQTMFDDVDLSWMAEVLQIFDSFTERTPRSFIEQRSTYVSWHYHDCDDSLGEQQARDMMKELLCGPLSNARAQIINQGQILQVRPTGVTKGTVAERIIADLETKRGKIDFVLCMGNFMQVFLSCRSFAFAAAKHMGFVRVCVCLSVLCQVDEEMFSYLCDQRDDECKKKTKPASPISPQRPPSLPDTVPPASAPDADAATASADTMAALADAVGDSLAVPDVAVPDAAATASFPHQPSSSPLPSHSQNSPHSFPHPSPLTPETACGVSDSSRLCSQSELPADVGTPPALTHGLLSCRSRERGLTLPYSVEFTAPGPDPYVNVYPEDNFTRLDRLHRFDRARSLYLGALAEAVSRDGGSGSELPRASAESDSDEDEADKEDTEERCARSSDSQATDLSARREASEAKAETTASTFVPLPAGAAIASLVAELADTRVGEVAELADTRAGDVAARYPTPPLMESATGGRVVVTATVGKKQSRAKYCLTNLQDVRLAVCEAIQLC